MFHGSCLITKTKMLYINITENAVKNRDPIYSITEGKNNSKNFWEIEVGLKRTWINKKFYFYYSDLRIF